ncbi:MAG: terminase small subunit [Candidatus Sedimenticola sp. PURPLELP]
MSRELTTKQRKFVRYYIQFGGNATRAAKEAGYGEASAHTTSHRMLKVPHIQQAIKEEAETVIRSGVAVAADVLVDLARNATSESVKLQAATALLDRGGLPFIRQSEHKHVVEDKRSDKELLESAKVLAQELGLNAKVIEGELVNDQ